MGWESFGVDRFDLWPLLRGQTRIAKLKIAYNLLIIGPTQNLYPLIGMFCFRKLFHREFISHYRSHKF